MKNQSDLHVAIKSELIEILYKNLSIGLIGIFLMASVVTWQLRDTSQATAVLVWYICLTLNLIVGLMLIIWYKKTKTNIALQNYHYYAYFTGSTITAILLGIIAGFLMPIELTNQTLIIIMIVCISSGSIQSLHSSYLAAWAFLLFSILPLLIWEVVQFWQGEIVYFGIFVATAGYTLYLIAEVYRGHTTITNNIILKLKNIKSNELLHKQKLEIEYLSKHDVITNLYNRRHLEDVISTYHNKLKLDNIKIGIFMFDIDHFKKVNDMFGHEAGDAVLKNFGKSIKDFFEDTPLAFRYGGEEFIVIFEGLSLKETYERAQAFRAYIKNSYLKPEMFGKALITISGGVAAHPDDGQDFYAIINQADKALYRAKSNGRDKIEMSQDHSALSRE